MGPEGRGGLTLTEMAAEAVRESTMRRKVYPGLIKGGRLKPAAAERQIELMDAIADHLLAEADQERRNASR